MFTNTYHDQVLNIVLVYTGLVSALLSEMFLGQVCQP